MHHVEKQAMFRLQGHQPVQGGGEGEAGEPGRPGVAHVQGRAARLLPQGAADAAQRRGPAARGGPRQDVVGAAAARGRGRWPPPLCAASDSRTCWSFE